MASATTTDLSDIETLLAKLRDVPADSHSITDSVLGAIYSHLMSVPATISGDLHWFCSAAESTTIAAATFLLRLFAYSSPEVDNWKKKFCLCLSKCSECVQGLEEVKETSKSTYFGAFNADILRGFYEGFEAWELASVLEDLSHAGLIEGSLINVPKGKTLADAPAAVIFRMVSNWTIFNDPRVRSIIYQAPPAHQHVFEWPRDTLPPGMCVLMMDERADVRNWAKFQASRTVSPILESKFLKSHIRSLEVITEAMTMLDHEALSLPHLKSSSSFHNNEIPFTSDLCALWVAFYTVLKLTPVNWLKQSPQQHLDLRHIVTSHLHDTGPQFPEVLRCLLLLLKRLSRDFWDGEGIEFPQIVFDAIKDNAAFLRMLQQINPLEERPWFLPWFSEYLHTIRYLPAFPEVLARIADFLCGETQHERFKSARPLLIETAVPLFQSAFRKDNPYTLSQIDVILHTLDIHSEVLVDIGFSQDYDTTPWIHTRTAVRALITKSLLFDIQSLSFVVKGMCRSLAHSDKQDRPDIPPLSVRMQMWTRLFLSVQPRDGDAMAQTVCIISQAAHLDLLRTKPFRNLLKIPNPGQGYTSGDQALKKVNETLAIIHDGFIGIMSKFADYSVSTSALDLLGRPGVVKAVIILLLSPVDNLHLGAKTLVGLAFDADDRLGCFRALLTNLPEAALDGIFNFLNTFTIYAPTVPEACSLSKSLVRCFTDIIDILCSSPEGLLHNATFVKSLEVTGKTGRLLELWDLMTKSLAVIFKRTPSWSISFENEDMIVWMRDALIFGRDMLAQRRVIETAAIENVDTSRPPGRLSDIGKKMVNSLQDVFLQVIRWLRLTDEELLHQSFALIESLFDVFRETHVRPSDQIIEKITKHTNSIGKAREGEITSRLDATRISKLEDTISLYDEEAEAGSRIVSKSSNIKEVIKARSLDQNQPKISDAKLRHTSKQTLLPPPSSKPSSSKFFTNKEQEALNNDIHIPKFRKPSTGPVFASKVISNEKKYIGPKNEALGQQARSKESDSDSSSEDEESQVGGLASLGTFPKSPKIHKQEPRRQIKTLDLVLHKNPMQERVNRREEARKIALRLKPDISGLHKILLSWDYKHDGPNPPGEKLQLLNVPNSFQDHDQYRRVFEPLLLLECWAQILQAKEEKQDSYPCKIGSRQHSDDWLDIEISFTESVKKDWYLAETDVILLRHPGTEKSILGKTQSYRATLHGTQANIRCFTQGGKRDPGLLINTTWNLCKVFSLSTLHREYAALVSLPYYDFYNAIMRPTLSKVAKMDKREISQIMSSYSVNEPQAVAISNSLQTEGFALIQGPPGTGKTSTICGLIAVFLSRRMKPVVPVHVGRDANPSEMGPVAKVLLCAPSNAAIDEIAHRIKDGFCGSKKKAGDVKVVRIGTSQSMNISVRDISLDYLVEQRLEGTQKPTKDSGDEIATLRREIESVKRLRLQKLAEVESANDSARSNALEKEIKDLNSRRMSLTRQFDFVKDKQKSDSRTLDALRRKTRLEVLWDADVICTTLSGAGHEILEQFDFEMVIIDEAAQAIELSSLIPLKYRCVRCVMVGDPQQLPPTVISQEATRYRYNQSLFVRLQQQRPDVVHLLSIQYRMHPDISILPSRIFYDGRLQDGPDMALKTKQAWQQHPKFGSYRFFNIAKGMEEQSGRSIKNIAECQVAVALYNRLRQEYSTFDFDNRIGVVSMYRAQIVELRRAFEQRFGKDISGRIDFNTVDGFQGQEKDVIILSCVRAGPGLQTVGFLSDTRRMNVALTRAKTSLFILGNAPTLERSDETWRNIVLDARQRQSLVDVDTSYFTQPTSSTTSTLSPPQTKTSKPVAKIITVAPVPTDLMTPQQFKEGSSASFTTVAEKRSTVTPSTVSNVEASSAPRGVKRPIENELAELVIARHDELVDKPKPPPTKRPKPPPSIFIPNKKKK